MRKVLVTGVAGSGKSTLGRKLAQQLRLPFHGLDSLYYGPDLEMSPAFPAEVDQITATEAWLFDSAGPPPDSAAPPSVRDLMWSRADTLVWLDYPRWVVLLRATRRSIRRIATREPLWHGHRETPRWWLRPDHPIRRAWHTQARREHVANRTRDVRWQHLTIVRLDSPHRAAAWLKHITSGNGE